MSGSQIDKTDLSRYRQARRAVVWPWIGEGDGKRASAVLRWREEKMMRSRDSAVRGGDD